uniref:adenosine 5'-monophosphoramidase HINT3-like isoform X2 n=1 Tax=Semicossyphus pulcher TaxID=241346 RepID=UPI0037E70513
MASKTTQEFVETCIFCFIATGQDEEAVVLKKHIPSCFSLHRGHIGLVNRMAEMGKEVLQDQGITDMMDIRMGFHQPPYTSVDHLHLHVLAPTRQISHFIRYKFTPGTKRFVTDELLSKCLQDKAPPVTGLLNGLLSYCCNETPSSEESEPESEPECATWRGRF